MANKYYTNLRRTARATSADFASGATLYGKGAAPEGYFGAGTASYTNKGGTQRFNVFKPTPTPQRIEYQKDPEYETRLEQLAAQIQEIGSRGQGFTGQQLTQAGGLTSEQVSQLISQSAASTQEQFAPLTEQISSLSASLAAQQQAAEQSMASQQERYATLQQQLYGQQQAAAQTQSALQQQLASQQQATQTQLGKLSASMYRPEQPGGRSAMGVKTARLPSRAFAGGGVGGAFGRQGLRIQSINV